ATRSSGFGSSVLSGFDFFHSSTTSGWSFAHARMYSPGRPYLSLAKSVLAQFVGPTDVSAAQVAVRSGTAANHASMSCCGVRGSGPVPADRLPFLYCTIGPSCCATRSRSFGLFAPQLLPLEAVALCEA